MSSLSRQQLVEFLREIDIDGRAVLDCGCGPARYHARNFVRGQPALYHTLDVDPAHEPDFVCDLNHHYLRLRSPRPIAEYDTVFLLETAEHLWHPIQALRSIWCWLKPGGELFFSAPFVNPIHDRWDYLRMTGEWWRKVAGELGFDVDFIKPRVATDGWPALKAFFQAEGLRMSKIRLKEGQGHKQAHVGYFGRMVKQ